MTSSDTLTDEARVLLTYVVGAPPPADMIELYRTAVLRHSTSRPLALPGLLHRCPALLRVCEPVMGGSSTLKDRVYMATLIAETQRNGSRRLYRYDRTNPLVAGLRICAAMSVEAILLVPRILISAAWRP